jgi:hypothetical protein
MLKSGSAGWPRVVRRGGSSTGIWQHGGGGGADMRGPRVNSRRERGWVGEKAQLKRENVKR